MNILTFRCECSHVAGIQAYWIKAYTFSSQVIRSDVSVFKLEDLGIEMPRGESQLTNVEGGWLRHELRILYLIS